MAYQGDDERLPSERGRHTSDQDLVPARTRVSSTWTLIALGVLVLLLLLVFALQNGQRVGLEFLWLDFTAPVGVTLLLAGAIGAVLAVLLGASRLLQLRLAARRHRRSHRG